MSFLFESPENVAGEPLEKMPRCSAGILTREPDSHALPAGTPVIRAGHELLWIDRGGTASFTVEGEVRGGRYRPLKPGERIIIEG